MPRDQRFAELNQKLIYLLFGLFVAISLFCPNCLLVSVMLYISLITLERSYLTLIRSSGSTSRARSELKFRTRVLCPSHRVFFYFYSLWKLKVSLILFFKNSPLFLRCPGCPSKSQLRFPAACPSKHQREMQF